MNIKKPMIAMGLAVVTVLTAYPASAKVYQYIVQRKDVPTTAVDTITYDNVNGTGSWTSSDNGLNATFNIPVNTPIYPGITPGFSLYLTNFSGTRVVSGVRYSVNLNLQQPNITFSQSGVIGDISVLAASWGSGQGGNLAFAITGFRDVTPPPPPAPPPVAGPTR